MDFLADFQLCKFHSNKPVVFLGAKKTELLLSHKGSWCYDHSQAFHIGDMTYLENRCWAGSMGGKLWLVIF